MSYTKYHDPWSATDLTHLSSGKAWNYIETQWDATKEDADAHNHDTRYYTKTASDAAFFTTAFYTDFDADKLDGQHFSDLVASVMPLGAIMIWSGTDAAVPTGWHICDGGTYGGKASPDMRDRFVIGAGGSYAVGATGGPATYDGTILPTGTVTVGNHQLTTTELPAHNHTFEELCNQKNIWQGDIGSQSSLALTSRSTAILAQASGDGTHTHAGSTATLAAINPRPKYHSLYYIMKYA
ncbi:hypothetical protein M0R72_19825 [Candidatus Pacearchaeota archaeon]|jgi:hypothetical protein|nr:hypothetical protein [Candidatus Pacearchaeota archaeon]